MSYVRFWASLAVLVPLSGCGGGVHAAATRVLDADAAVLSSTPICFVRPSPELSLSTRAEQTNIVQICEDVARKEGLQVVPLGNAPCLAVTMAWSTRNTGDWSGECTPSFMGSECTASSIHAKSVKMVLTQSTTGKVVAENSATIASDHGGFSDKSFRALCTAAFHDFPKPLSSAQFNVSD